MSLPKLTFLLTLVSLLTIVVSSTQQINVNKCCNIDEELLIDKKPANNDVVCIKTNLPWTPTYYNQSLPPPNKFVFGLPKTWKINNNKLPICSDDNVIDIIINRSANPIIIWSNGGAVLGTGLSFYQPNTFCADKNAIIVCVPKKNVANHAASTTRPRIHRCCLNNAVFSNERNTCENVKDPEDISKKLMPINSSSAEILPGFPTCANGQKYVIVGDSNNGVLQSDGGLIVDGINLPPLEYCVELIKELDGKGKIFACSEHAPKSNPKKPLDYRFIMYPISFLISAIFLAATLGAGWLLPASHHVLHWRCQTHHVVCLMFGDLLMAIIQLWSDSLPEESCKAIAILTHFFFLAAFFWLNTMCFNIWWTFRDLRPASLEKGQETLRLRVYACYAWGGPLLVAGLAAILDHLPPQENYTFLRPQFGRDKCWFYGDTEILAYFYGPIGLLLAINVIFFVATARELTCGLWKGEFVKSTTERAALGRVCLKLVVVMGVTWGFDIISWIAGGPHYLWYATDLLNALQGLFIFMVVGWQPQVRAGLKRLFNKNPRTNAGRQGNGLSTTSHGMPSMGDSVTQNPSTKTAPLETIC